jgi:hypothetical protein
MAISLRGFLESALSYGALAVCIMCAGTAKADILSYDQTLASPDTTAAASNNLSWYNGSGNSGVQGGWTVDTNNGIELGLRAQLREVNSVINTPTNDYVVPVGGCTTSPCDTGSGGSQPSLALWNYEFSIDLDPNGAANPSPLNIEDIAPYTFLTITDLTTSTSGTVNLLDCLGTCLAGDNSGFGTPGGLTGTNRINESLATLAAFAAGYGAQNSENPGFGNDPLLGFNPNSTDAYQIQLTVADSGGTLATDVIDINPVPEPSAIILLSTLAFLAFRFGRRRRMA